MTHCELDPPHALRSKADPRELDNLALDSAHAETVRGIYGGGPERWDMARFDDDVRQSQARRWVVYEALRNGAYYPWDFQPLQKASERYMRNHMDLNVLEQARFPRGQPLCCRQPRVRSVAVPICYCFMRPA